MQNARQRIDDSAAGVLDAVAAVFVGLTKLDDPFGWVGATIEGKYRIEAANDEATTSAVESDAATPQRAASSERFASQSWRRDGVLLVLVLVLVLV